MTPTGHSNTMLTSQPHARARTASTMDHTVTGNATATAA
jgi:hypothetical protein